MEIKFNFRLLSLLRHTQEREKIIISLSLFLSEEDVSLSQESILCSLRDYDDDIGLYTNKRVMYSLM